MSEESEFAALALELDELAGGVGVVVACGRAVDGLSACSVLECWRIAESTDILFRLFAA
jgi:hypothetical protein